MTKNIWVSSDHHLFHSNMLKFTDRDGKLIRGAIWDNIDDMNQDILERHNSVVKKGDIHYCLGDVIMDSGRGTQQYDQEFKKLWPKFNGSKRLIVGNHDPIAFLSAGGFFKKTYESRTWKEEALLMTHRPCHITQLEDLHGNLIRINVHGHIHSNIPPVGPHINVSLEAIDYTPVHIEDLALQAKTYLNTGAFK